MYILIFHRKTKPKKGHPFVLGCTGPYFSEDSAKDHAAKLVPTFAPPVDHSIMNVEMASDNLMKNCDLAKLEKAHADELPEGD